jgi:hypothetical protein
MSHRFCFNLNSGKGGIAGHSPVPGPAGSLRSPQFAPGELVEPNAPNQSLPALQIQQAPKGGLLYLAVVAVCCEPVSGNISLLMGNLQGIFAFF